MTKGLIAPQLRLLHNGGEGFTLRRFVMKTRERERIFLPMCVFNCKGKTNIAGWALYDCSRKQPFPRLFANRKDALDAAARAARNPLQALPPGLDAMFQGLTKELWPAPVGAKTHVIVTTDHAPGARWRGEAANNALTGMESGIRYIAERCLGLWLLALATGGIAWALGCSYGKLCGWAIFCAVVGLAALGWLCVELSRLRPELKKRHYFEYVPLGPVGGDPRLN